MTRYVEEDELVGDVSDYDPHVYDGERCITCNVNTYDDAIYGPFPCTRDPQAEPIAYRTETPDG